MKDLLHWIFAAITLLGVVEVIALVSAFVQIHKHRPKTPENEEEQLDA